MHRNLFSRSFRSASAALLAALALSACDDSVLSPVEDFPDPGGTERRSGVRSPAEDRRGERALIRGGYGGRGASSSPGKGTWGAAGDYGCGMPRYPRRGEPDDPVPPSDAAAQDSLHA